jgi:hypothetical protein
MVLNVGGRMAVATQNLYFYLKIKDVYLNINDVILKE